MGRSATTAISKKEVSRSSPDRWLKRETLSLIPEIPDSRAARIFTFPSSRPKMAVNASACRCAGGSRRLLRSGLLIHGRSSRGNEAELEQLNRSEPCYGRVAQVRRID